MGKLGGSTIAGDLVTNNNPDGSTNSQIIRLGQDQSTVTSSGGYDYDLIQSGAPSDFVFSLNYTNQSASVKHDTGTWRAADGASGATYDNLGTETKSSRVLIVDSGNQLFLGAHEFLGSLRF